MRTKIFTLLMLALIFVTSAYAQDSAEPITANTTVHRFADGSIVENASSQLVRFDNGVTMTLSTNDLVPGDVYTVWWVIFNEPQNCSDGACNIDDLFVLDADGQIVKDELGNRVMNPDALTNANVSIQHASGSLSDNGTLNVSASLGLGEVPGIIFGPGLLDAHKAEVHLVIRTHGPKVDDVFDAQISTFGGGCDPIDTPPCDDVQFAFYLPAAS
jgi:hypothetical protein